jgi:hypothetical protein
LKLGTIEARIQRLEAAQPSHTKSTLVTYQEPGQTKAQALADLRQRLGRDLTDADEVFLVRYVSPPPAEEALTPRAAPAAPQAPQTPQPKGNKMLPGSGTSWEILKQ